MLHTGFAAGGSPYLQTRIVVPAKAGTEADAGEMNVGSVRAVQAPREFPLSRGRQLS